jgi:uncharacterized repeat protein (TIGR02543 family)
VTYNGNGADTGSVPVDSTRYSASAAVTVAGNTGSLTKAGYTFAGWNTKNDGTGTTYTQGETFHLTASITLYALWTALPTYTVTYDANGGTGTPPTDTTHYLTGAAVTIPGNTDLSNAGYTFTGWNTKDDGSGTTYAVNATLTMGSSNVILYALWTALPTHTLSYDANGAESGSVPDGASYYEGQAVTVADNTGNLFLTDYAFDGWADSSGKKYAAGSGFFMGTADITLHAVWKYTKGDAAVSTTIQGDVTVTAKVDSPIAKGTDFNATASADSPVDSWAWYLDGILVDGQTTGTFTGGASLDLGPHTIMAVVYKNTIPYSASRGFTVK